MRLTDRSGDGELRRTFEVEGPPHPLTPPTMASPGDDEPRGLDSPAWVTESRRTSQCPEALARCGAKRLRLCPLFWRRCIVPTQQCPAARLQIALKGNSLFALSIKLHKKEPAAFLIRSRVGLRYN